MLLSPEKGKQTDGLISGIPISTERKLELVLLFALILIKEHPIIKFSQEIIFIKMGTLIGPIVHAPTVA